MQRADYKLIPLVNGRGVVKVDPEACQIKVEYRDSEQNITRTKGMKMTNVLRRMLFVLMIPLVGISTVLLLGPALIWWILSGRDLLDTYISWLNSITPEFPNN